MSDPTHTLHCFFAGTHESADGSVHTFSEADVADLVASYDPALSEAQLVVGHPKIEDPSYGGVASLSLADDGVHAEPCNVHPEFAELVNAGRYPTISASIYKPASRGNPKPGHFYLRHIGFLGGHPPALKGLKRPKLPANFAEADEDCVEFSMPLSLVGGAGASAEARKLRSLGSYLKRMFQALRDREIETSGVEKADQLIPQWTIDSIVEATALDDNAAAFAEGQHTPKETDMGQLNAADFAAREDQLNTRSTDLDKREKALADREAAARRDDAAEFADGLVLGGKILPRQKTGVVELLLALPAGTVLNFAEGDGQEATDHDASDLLRTFLDDLPQRVDFAEKSGDTSRGTVAASVDFAAPAGAKVDAERLQLHTRALAYQAEHPGTPYLTAVKAVGG